MRWLGYQRRPGCRVGRKTGAPPVVTQASGGRWAETSLLVANHRSRRRWTRRCCRLLTGLVHNVLTGTDRHADSATATTQAQRRPRRRGWSVPCAHEFPRCSNGRRRGPAPGWARAGLTADGKDAPRGHPLVPSHVRPRDPVLSDPLVARRHAHEYLAPHLGQCSGTCATLTIHRRHEPHRRGATLIRMPRMHAPAPT